MSLTVDHCLDIYSTRLKMQKDGVTSPSESVKRFTEEIVLGLKRLDGNTKIDLIQSKGTTSFVIKKTGEILATLT